MELAVVEQRVDLVPKRRDGLDQLSAVAPRIGKIVPSGKDFGEGGAEVLAPLTDRPRALGKRGEIALEVSEADLATRDRNLPIDPIPVGTDQTRERLAQQRRENRR